jgi:hypothetical protein
MQAITCEVILTSASTRADGSLGLRLATPELTTQEKVALLDLQGKQLKALFQPMGEEPEGFVEVKTELGFKTPGQRLRGCLFVWWQQSPEPKPTFENFYVERMESIITHIKTKLQPE